MRITDFESRICDGKESCSHYQIDALIHLKNSGQFLFHTGNVSQLCSDRRGIALLTRAKSWKEKKKKSCYFFEAVLRLVLQSKLSVRLGSTQSGGCNNVYDLISDLCYESPVCHSIK